jgi:hypothetical protein
VIINIVVFWVVTPCILLMDNDVLGEYAVSIFIVEVWGVGVGLFA